MRTLFILMAVLIFLFSLYSATQAGAMEVAGTTFIRMNKLALEKGYTVKSIDDFFWLPIFPNQFVQGQVTIELSKLKILSSLPENLQIKSGFYFYDVKKDGVSVDKPVLLSLKYFNAQDGERALYILKENKWQKLESKDLKRENLIRAWSDYSSGMIVIAEEKLVDENGLTAAAAIVMDDSTGQILFAKNLDQVRPVASLTKIITALVFLDHNPGWDKLITMKKCDNVGGAAVYVRAGDHVSVKDLFFATLVGSKNNAAMALVRATGLTKDEFVKKMNSKAREIGAFDSYFEEPTGLSEKNISTVMDMAKIMKTAFRNFKMLEATTVKWYALRAHNRNQTYWIKNTNKLVTSDLYVTGGKTGWTDEAGYCLGTKARASDGRNLIALVLGAKMRKNYEEVYKLLKEFF